MVNPFSKLEIEEHLASSNKSSAILGLSSRGDLIQVIDYTDDGSQIKHGEPAT